MIIETNLLTIAVKKFVEFIASNIGVCVIDPFFSFNACYRVFILVFMEA